MVLNDDDNGNDDNAMFIFIVLQHTNKNQL